jgi:hypothetical protein
VEFIVVCPRAVLYRRFVCDAPGCETRLVTAMNKDAAAKRVVLEHRPSTSVDAIPFVGSIKGELDGRLAIALNHAIVKPYLDGDEAHLTLTVTIECEVRRAEQVEIFSGPQLHPSDAPASHERPACGGVSSSHPSSQTREARTE